MLLIIWGNWLWPMKPFGGHGDRRRCLFDRKLSSARMVVECTFGCLKLGWRCLTAHLPIGIQNVVPVISLACVIVHNVCKKGHTLLSNEVPEEGLKLPYPQFHQWETMWKGMQWEMQRLLYHNCLLLEIPVWLLQYWFFLLVPAFSETLWLTTGLFIAW